MATKEDTSWSAQIGAVVGLIINILIFSLIIWWLSSANAYLHDNVRSPNDPRRVKLRQLIDVSMGIAVTVVVISTFSNGKIFLGILQLLVILIPSIMLSNYLKNTENPNFEQNFPSFWITASIIFNSLFGIAGLIYITAKIITAIAGEEDKKLKLPSTGLLGTGSDLQTLELRIAKLETGGTIGSFLDNLELDLEI